MRADFEPQENSTPSRRLTVRAKRLRVVASAATACVIAILAARSAQAQTYKVLHTFHGIRDGSTPEASMIQDGKGNLYGTTGAGGKGNFGTVFELSKTGRETLLSGFVSGKGISPFAGVIQDAEGNLYGTTDNGGSGGAGTVFKLSKTGHLTALYSFTGQADGGNPIGSGVIRDALGNLYGTTAYGGELGACKGGMGCGVVFRLSKTGKQTVLHTFCQSNCNDGALPLSGVIQDAKGNLYGTASWDGFFGWGTIFRLSKSGKETVLYSFKGANDGASPVAIILDAKGNIYGTTNQGGGSSECVYGCGTVFKLDTTGKETILHRFTGGADGASPYLAGVIQDAEGNLYGTTSEGGNTSCSKGCGVVFELSKACKESILYSFTGGSDGAYPLAGLIRDAGGNLYGTASSGGDLSCVGSFNIHGCGVIFKITP